MKKSVTIYTGDLVQIKVKKGDLQLSSNAEKELKKLLNAQAFVNGLLDGFKYKMAEAMEEANVSLIEKGDIKITRSMTGRRFAFDPKATVDPKFTQTTSYQQPNTKTIDAFLELEGKIPEGILENDRKVKVDIEVIDPELIKA